MRFAEWIQQQPQKVHPWILRTQLLRALQAKGYDWPTIRATAFTGELLAKLGFDVSILSRANIIQRSPEGHFQVVM